MPIVIMCTYPQCRLLLYKKEGGGGGSLNLYLTIDRIDPSNPEDPNGNQERFYDGVKPGKGGRPKLLVSSLPASLTRYMLTLLIS